jgi:nucleoside-diphosphate-sugar epimerase
VSSLAARAPDLSPYAESKALGEREALRQAGRLEVVVVRPPAVYGPGDRATLPIMRSLAAGLLLAPRQAGARFSLLHAGDLAGLLAKLAAAGTGPASGTVLEPDDGRDRGYSWAELAGLASRHLGRKVRVVAVPRAVASLAAAAAERCAGAGRPPLLSRVKVAELFHPDWICDPASLEAWGGWSPGTDFARGLPATLAWYRHAGWL